MRVRARARIGARLVVVQPVSDAAQARLEDGRVLGQHLMLGVRVRVRGWGRVRLKG